MFLSSLGRSAVVTLAAVGLLAGGCESSNDDRGGQVKSRDQQQQTSPDGTQVRQRTQVRQTPSGQTVKETETQTREPVQPGTSASQ